MFRGVLNSVIDLLIYWCQLICWVLQLFGFRHILLYHNDVWKAIFTLELTRGMKSPMMNRLSSEPLVTPDRLAWICNYKQSLWTECTPQTSPLVYWNNRKQRSVEFGFKNGFYFIAKFQSKRIFLIKRIPRFPNMIWRWNFVTCLITLDVWLHWSGTHCVTQIDCSKVVSLLTSIFVKWGGYV